MIKTIIKFGTGEQEPFIATKLKRWAEYAAENLPVAVDWESILLDVVNEAPSVLTSQELQQRLIDRILRGETWSHYLMAGRLLAPLLHKATFGATMPTVKDLHAKLVGLEYMVALDYSDKEYAQVESIINHNIDKTMPHFRLDYIYKKYGLQNRVTRERYETPQYTYMRMAMALAEDQPRNRRMRDVERFYYHLSGGRINAPTPNFVNLGTPLNGYASCCIYSNDDSAASIGVGLHIAYTMTYMSAGCGTHLNTRSLGDAVRNGMIEHQGKLPYIRATKAMVEANLQNGRGGADTLTWQAYDPEGETLVSLANPMSVDSKKIRGIDYSMSTNKWMAKFAAQKQKLFRFNCYTAPDLYAALYSGDTDLFETLYNKYEQDPLFVKDYFNAREQILLALNEAYETGRYYLTWVDEMNRHTPFYDPIFASNLCQEIMLHQRGYEHMMDLYANESVGRIDLTTDDGQSKSYQAVKEIIVTSRGNRKVIPAIELKVGDTYRETDDGKLFAVGEITFRKFEPEVAMCNIGAVVPSMIESDEEYAEVMYYTLLMIDVCIHKAHYELPHIGYTSKARMNAGVGIMGLAHWMAKNDYRYDDVEGKNAMHRLHETHLYHAITQSIKLGEERGNAPWMHRTKWPEGYLPIDSYNKNVDAVHTQELLRDWAPVRAKLIANKGMRFSCVVSHMPGESSSKASGQPNSLYPVRKLVITKTDKNIKSYWAAPEGDVLGSKYQIAWDLSMVDQVDMYAIGQKFTDQGISADLWRRIGEGEKITSTEMLQGYFYMTKMGLKSRYYQNSMTSKEKRLDDGSVAVVESMNTDGEEAADCGTGGCKM
jgi:ribonucleoside-diphosphate reductase alpha chain